jgi:hypothetical protein
MSTFQRSRAEAVSGLQRGPMAGRRHQPGGTLARDPFATNPSLRAVHPASHGPASTALCCGRTFGLRCRYNRSVERSSVMFALVGNWIWVGGGERHRLPTGD